MSAEGVKVENGYLKLYAMKKADNLLTSVVSTKDHHNDKE
jgi:hypothetical protein